MGFFPKRLRDLTVQRVLPCQREGWMIWGWGDREDSTSLHFRMSICLPPPHSQHSGLKLAEFIREKEGTISDTSAPSAFGAVCHNGC